jgi:hypothetical protein
MTPDPEWDAELAEELAPWEPPLRRIFARLAECPDIQSRLVAGHTPFPAYVAAKAEDHTWESESGRAALECAVSEGFRVADLGQELHVLPAPLGKKKGMTAFIEKYCGGNPPLLAVGDMPEDLGFLTEAVFMAAPVGSPLARRWVANGNTGVIKVLLRTVQKGCSSCSCRA